MNRRDIHFTEWGNSIKEILYVYPNSTILQKENKIINLTASKLSNLQIVLSSALLLHLRNEELSPPLVQISFLTKSQASSPVLSSTPGRCQPLSYKDKDQSTDNAKEKSTLTVSNEKCLYTK